MSISSLFSDPSLCLYIFLDDSSSRKCFRSCQCLSERQVVFYQSGVGTDLDAKSNLIQGATGKGLFEKVIEAYSWLVDNYVPGDEIFLFGFSRGSYTARSIGGFINWGGILPAKLSGNFSQIFTAYQQRKPDNPDSIKKASDIFQQYTGLLPSLDASETSSIHLEHSDTELNRDVDQEDVDGDSSTETVGGRVEPPQIKFIGCFDTVGALGVPGRFMDPDLQVSEEVYGSSLGCQLDLVNFSPNLSLTLSLFLFTSTRSGLLLLL